MKAKEERNATIRMVYMDSVAMHAVREKNEEANERITDRCAILIFSNFILFAVWLGDMGSVYGKDFRLIYVHFSCVQ